MDNKFLKKVANFLKKEGFYVILFVCLCIVATVAAITITNSKHTKNQPIEQNGISQNDSAAVADESSVKYDNALQVKKSSAQATVNKTAAVASSTETKFLKPVEGSIARGYTEDPVFWDSTSTYRPNLGYDIKAQLGKPVVAVMDGKIESVDLETRDGVEIIINHQNGVKTVYSNLEKNVKITKGQSVKKGETIGSVGNTSLRAGYEKYGTHLHFAVLKGKDYIDPGKYIKY